MSKLIGSGPNQVPSNADLGTAAFVDAKEFLSARGSNMSAINGVIELTGVNDVFVYDTSKDSDGGAWRKRVQHTSWYNEQLNTWDRGSRREFPAVAVISCRDDGVYIYDGDDPTLPMWMRFVGNDGGAHWAGTTNDPYRCHMLNGELMMGFAVSGGCRKINFIDETIFVLYDVSGVGHTQRGIAERNGPLDWVGDNYYIIADRGIEDIIGIVPEGAPIIPSTGLPGVKWAIATDGGTSIVDPKINHSNEAASYHIHNITGFLGGTETEDTWCNFDPEGVLWIGDRGQGQTNGGFYPLGFKGSDDNFQASEYDYAYKTTASGLTSPPGPYVLGRTRQMRGNAFVGEQGVTLAKHNYNNIGKSHLAYITHDYNTGWLPGETVISLSDTENGMMNGNNLVPNGSFTTTAHWTFSGSGEYSIDTSQGLLVDASSSGHTVEGDYFYLPITGTYQLSYYITGSGGTPTVYVLDSNDATKIQAQVTSDPYDGKVTGTFNGTAGEKVYIRLSGTAFTGNYKWICVRLNSGYEKTDSILNRNIAEEYAKQFMVQNTVLKTPIAKGCDLVAYSGFDEFSSYMEQPYNSELDIGTGNFTIAFWSRPEAGAYECIFSRADYTNEGYGVRIGPDLKTYQFWAGNSVRLQCPGGSSNDWNFVVMTRQSGIMRGYVNGNLIVRGTYSNDIDSGLSDPTLRIGDGGNSGSSLSLAPYEGSIALFRITKTPVYDNDVREMYEDEKKLFMSGVQATLFGTSRDTLAVAYDDITKEYHFGTSSGRSVFQGLQRVDYTSEGVETTISASNGFVAED